SPRAGGRAGSRAGTPWACSTWRGSKPTCCGSNVRDELLAIADQIRALATTGLHYTEGPFDRERYEKLLVLAARLAAHGAGEEPATLLELFRAADQGYVTPKLAVRLALF